MKKTHMKKNENFLFSSNVKPISKQRKIQSKQEKRFTLRNRGGKKGSKRKKKNLFQMLQQLARRQGRGK
jgi:hypothetical protein